MTTRQALAFVRRHGVVLEAGRGGVPNLAEKVAGQSIRGSWWGHPKGQEIFVLSRAVRESPDVVVCRLVSGKVTFVHRRLWPTLVAAAPLLRKRDLAAIRDTHTASGAHRQTSVPFPAWVPMRFRRASLSLPARAALAALRENRGHTTVSGR